MKKKSRRPAPPPAPPSVATDFDAWLSGRFADGGAFTALIVVMSVEGTRVEPVASTYAHVIGDEIAWTEMLSLLDSSGKPWDAVVIYAASMEKGGTLEDPAARQTLRRIEEEILRDRRTINAGHFFDRLGRRLRLDEVGPAN